MRDGIFAGNDAQANAFLDYLKMLLKNIYTTILLKSSVIFQPRPYLFSL